MAPSLTSYEVDLKLAEIKGVEHKYGDLKPALEKVAANSGLSFDSVRKRYEKLVDNGVEWGPPLDHRRDLQQADEHTLLGVLKGFACCNIHLSVDDVMTLVRTHFTLPPSFNFRGWFSRFKIRYKDLIGRRSFKLLSKTRAASSRSEYVEKYIEAINHTMSTYPISATTGVLAADEFLVYVHQDALVLRRIPWRRKKQNCVVAKQPKLAGSVLVVGSSNGHVLMTVVVCKACETTPKVNLPVFDYHHHHERLGNVYYSATSTGLMQPHLWKKSMEKLCQLVKEGYDSNGHQMNRLLFLDNLALHRNIDVLWDLLIAKISVVFYAGATTLWAAPPDNTWFAQLRNLFNHGVSDRLSVNMTSKEAAGVMIQCLLDAGQDAFTVPVIKKAFENCGLVPYNPDLLRTLSRRCSGKELPHSSHEPSLVQVVGDIVETTIHAREERTTPLWNVEVQFRATNEILDGDAVIALGLKQREEREYAQKRKAEQMADRERKKLLKAEEAAKKLEKRRTTTTATSAITTELSTTTPTTRSSSGTSTARYVDNTPRYANNNYCVTCGLFFENDDSGKPWHYCSACSNVSYCGQCYKKYRSDSGHPLLAHEAVCKQLNK